MAKKITIDIEVNGKMQKATVSANKLNKAMEGVSEGTDKATKSQQSQDRALKGTAKASSNSTKNFSKMAQGITGGLVPAYATLAANLFAVSAAFNFLKRAAQLKQLEESQVAYAARTGVALQSVTQRLRETSQGMLGFQEAAQAAAIGVAKGFSPNQLNKLAEGALKASQALGRDFADAFDRLVRGVSKAEPELLDELGITLRLEQATRSYAGALGLQADQLTETQRSQAVLVETQRQLDLLFGGEPLEANAFVQVQKAFEDLIRTITDIFLPVFNTIATIISGNIGAAITVFGFFALSILKAVVPMDKLDKSVKKFTKNANKEYKKATKAVNKYTKAIEKSKRTAEETRAKGKVDFRTAAQTAVEQGAPSKILKKAADEGFDSLRATDKKNLQRFLDAAEKNVDSTGKVIKGAFKGVSISIIRDMQKSLGDINTKTGAVGSRWKRMTTRMRLEWKRAQAFIQKVQARSTQFLINQFKKIGRAFTRVVKVFSIVGIAMILIQAFQEFKYQLDNMVRSIALAIDSVVSMLPGMGDFMFFQNLYKDSALEDTLQGFAKQGEAFKDVQNRSDGLKDRIRELREDVIASEESFKSYTNQMVKFGLTGKKELHEVAHGMRTTLQTNVAATSGMSELVKEVEALRNLEGEGADAAATERLNELEDTLRIIGNIIPEVKAVLESGLEGDALVSALFQIEQGAQTSNRAITDFKDKMTVLGEAFTSGNINQIATSFFEAKKQLVELNKNVDPSQAKAFTKEFQALAKDFGGVEALEERLQRSVDAQEEFIARDAVLSIQQVKTGQMVNKFAKERAARADDIVAKQLSIDKIDQQILDTEVEMAKLGSEQRAEKERLLDQLEAQKAAEVAILGLTEEQKAVLDEITNLNEKASDLSRQSQILAFRQQINSEIQKQLSLQKQLVDLEIQNIENAAKQAIADATASSDPRSIFQDDNQFKLEAEVALQEALLVKRKEANQLEFDTKMQQIAAEERMAQIKRKQTGVEIALLKKQLEREDKEGKTNKNAKMISDLEGILSEVADGGAFEKSIATSADLSRQVAVNMKNANDQKFEDMVANSKRALANSSAMADVLDTVGDSFRSSLTQTFDAVFDNLADSSVDLSQKLKDIARSFVKTIRKAITKRFIVDPIMDALDNLINPNKKTPGQLVKQAHQQGAKTVGTAIVTGAKAQQKALETGADTVKEKIEEALGRMIEVCCCKDPVGPDGDPVNVTNVDQFEDAFSRALSDQASDDHFSDALKSLGSLAGSSDMMGGGGGEATTLATIASSFMAAAKKPVDFLMGEKTDHAFDRRTGEHRAKIVPGHAETAIRRAHGEEGIISGKEAFEGHSKGELDIAENQRAGGIFGDGGPVHMLQKNLKANFTDFTGKLSNLFSGKGDFLTNLKGVFTSGGEIFSGLFNDLGGTFGKLFDGLLGGLGGMFDGLMGMLSGGGGGDLLGTIATVFGMGFAQGGYTSAMKDYSKGGVAKGPRSGYPAVLHGNEAVVPLPGGNKIPVEMTGAPSTGTVNSSVNININNATGAAEVSTESDAQEAKQFSQQISAVVQAEIRRQQRAGGFLSPHRAK